ncbi:MAG: tRNA (uridine(34)/cytosine(34)/5-carboxymethylaminomethyluridine(34)-2'-O)-methyltransferase TrmL [Gammaproteobacteria bacterium]|nr:tRNA (uridine(34)/cytosine(34)/5-carboxymethylaminomethyluridine(34)-2'-O)-methyltransferase TrmL [Gammaproteobacteria bacterium]
MFRLALYQPEIAPNTGNIIRLCANTGSELHLIKPLGFELDDKRLRRAGLDYAEWTSVRSHENWESFTTALAGSRIFAATTRASQAYSAVTYHTGDVFLFGPETRGLPQSILETLGSEYCVRIPMLPHSRSLNLSNSAAVLLYEAWRQQDFSGAGEAGCLLVGGGV